MQYARWLAYPVSVLIGVAVGQLAAWVVGFGLSFAFITEFVAGLVGIDAAQGLVWVVGSVAYAAVVGWSVSVGLAIALAQREPGYAEVLTGLAAGALAFLLVTLWAEPFVRLLIAWFPDAARVLVETSGVVPVAAAIAVHGITVGLAALIAYLPLRSAAGRTQPVAS